MGCVCAHLCVCVGERDCLCGLVVWLQIQRSQVLFPALPDFLRSNGSGKGSTQPRELGDFASVFFIIIILNSEGGFLDRGEELPPFSPVMPARGPPYADEDVDAERSASPPLYAAQPYTEAQVSGQFSSCLFLTLPILL
jgi:hypothetical protein